MIVRMQQRRGTTTEWTSVNPVLASGEFGYDKDSGEIKIGDGVTAWNSLANVGDRANDGSKLGYAENRTGAASFSTAGGLIIPGVIVAIPPTPGDIRLTWSVSLGISVPGEGVLQSLIFETTNGGAAIVGAAANRFETNSIATQQAGGQVGVTILPGLTTQWRSFALAMSHYSATGSALTGYALNYDTDYAKSFLMVEAL